MDPAQEDIFARLNAAIEDWNAQLTDSHLQLTSKITSAREHLFQRLESGGDAAAHTALADGEAEQEQASAAEALDGVLAAAQAEIESLRGALVDQSARAEALEAEIAGARTALEAQAEAAAEAEALSLELAAERQRAGDLQEQLAEAQTRLDALGQDQSVAAEAQGAALAEAHGQCEELGAEVAHLRGEVESGRGELETRALEWETERAEAREHAGGLAEELAAAQAELDEMRSALEESRGRVKTLLAEQEELDALRGELNYLRAQLAAQSEAMRFESVEASLSEAKETARKLEAEKADLMAQLAAARADLDALLHPGEADAAGAVGGGPLSVEAFDAKGQKKRMGAILVDAGVLTEAQLAEALATQKRQPQRRFGAILVESGYATEGVIAQVLAAQLHLSCVDLVAGDIEPAAVAMLPAHIAKTHQCIPVKLDSEVLLQVAFANPLDLIGIENVERATDCRVNPIVATPSQIEAALKESYPSLR